MRHLRTGQLLTTAITGLAAAALSGCAAGYGDIHSSSDVPYKGLGRLATLTDFIVAYELQPACSLQRAEASIAPPDPEQYKPVDPATLNSRTFSVSRRKFHSDVDGRVDFVALEVQQGDGTKFWLRNKPTSSMSEAALAWRCVVATDWVKERVPKNQARVVELAPSSSGCPALIPIAGTVDDVTFAPYTVAGVGVYAGAPPRPQDALTGAQGMLAVGVRLEAEGGEKSLLVPTAVFDRCFVPATRVPPKPSEAKALMDWLTGSNPDETTPPAVTRETIQTVAGLDASTCFKEGSGATEHLECRGPLLRVGRSDAAGPFGPPLIEFTRERFVDAIHLYGDKLIPSTEIVAVTALVRPPKLNREGTFAKVFQDELRESIGHADKARLRASRGFRVVGANDASKIKATHLIDIELDYQVPELETTKETRTHKYIAGKKRVHNPEYDKAEKELEQARADVPNAESKLKLAEQALAAGEAMCKKGADQLGWLAGALAKGACGATSAAGVTAARNAVNNAKERLAKATSNLSNTPSEIDVDDEREWKYEARILRRRGAANARLTISTDKQAVLYTATISVPFDASDVEIQDDPEHKLVGKKAAPPSIEEVERALAQAVMPRIDEAVVKWGAQRQVGGDIGDLVPGSRSWMVAVARRASNDRPIKLLSDILENRKDKLSAKELFYPVRIPAGSEKRCYAIAAIPTGGRADVNIALGRVTESSRFIAVARDARKGSDAGLEICGLAGGEYSIRVSFGDDERLADGVLISLFDSTTGAATNADTLAASKGLPTMPRKGQELVLDGSGATRFVASAGKVVVGKTGDRDGDGVLDEDDRCPYDQETANKYLDEDGCPDVPPAGWKPPDSVATAAPPVPTQQVKAEVEPPASQAKKPEPKASEARPDPKKDAKGAAKPAAKNEARPEPKKPEARPEPKKPEPKKDDGKKKPAVFIP